MTWIFRRPKIWEAMSSTCSDTRSWHSLVLKGIRIIMHWTRKILKPTICTNLQSAHQRYILTKGRALEQWAFGHLLLWWLSLLNLFLISTWGKFDTTTPAFEYLGMRKSVLKCFHTVERILVSGHYFCPTPVRTQMTCLPASLGDSDCQLKTLG